MTPAIENLLNTEIELRSAIALLRSLNDPGNIINSAIRRLDIVNEAFIAVTNEAIYADLPALETE